uniref:Uncharacterized protein n=1 Tax=Candidatus Kentrum sp. SD TaxID=2126332 RepID=A0A450YI05_9GAMM|nr:MAG: hypothetical protein BECKSD772F_GA0070984_101031 [Candidatus Kentron sp. SD]VFK41187.1 MAG: hypothetical protein BECKSD772E_GA0070983_101028 [Candidatus Kentron sp. SD]VFK78294.1 MAG: hypothetical protein BECKSD772D_GA0070982_101125 [Candidatus Kentron sp. SD]
MSWGCPNEVNGTCLHVAGRACDPGMKGCVLFGRFVFSNTKKNRPGGPRERGPGREENGPGQEANRIARG